MIIKELTVRLLGEVNRKPIAFNKGTHFIISSDNSKGKTTLLRLIVFALCFNVPMTKGLESSKIETTIVTERNNKSITIIRKGNYVTIVRDGGKINLNIKNNADFASIVSYVFGIEKNVSSGDLLGTIYLDQDNGWNLLSSGKVVGDAKFNASNAIETLFVIDTTDIDRKISSIERDIKRYQLVEKALEIKTGYTIDIDVFAETDTTAAENDELWIQRNKLLRKKEALKEKIRHITDVIKSKENIESYIDELGIMVQENKDSSPFRLTKDKLFLNDANLDGLRAQRMLYESSLRSVYKELEKYPSNEKKDNPALFNVEKSSMIIEKALQNVPNLSISKTKAIIDELKAEKEKLIRERRELVKEGNSSSFIDSLEFLFKKHLSYFGMLTSVYDGSDISVEHYLNRGRFSGAELAKVTLSYRLAFHEAFCKENNANLPLIIDSPGSKELKSDVVLDIINYAIGYGREEGMQIFISTIRTDSIKLNEDNHHILKGKAIDLFEEEGLL